MSYEQKAMKIYLKNISVYFELNLNKYNINMKKKY